MWRKIMAQTIKVDWSYSGKADPLAGTGATVSERALAYGFAALVTFGLVGYLRLEENPIAYGWRLALLVFFVFDVVGGVVANMLNSCKRLYHSPAQPDESRFIKIVKNPLAFTIIHIHPIIAAWAFYGEIWVGVFWYAALVLSAAVTLATPLYLRRPVATAFVVIASITSFYSLSLGAGLEWFVPCLFFKIVLAHAVREEPYRPG